MVKLHVDDFEMHDATDDTTAIKAALDAVNSEDDEVVFSPFRTYRVNSTIHLKRCKYRGNNTLIKPCPGVCFDFSFATDPQMRAVFVLSNLENFTLSMLDFTVDPGTGVMSTGFAVSG